ncbi:MAG: acetyltransferase [Bryobacteraceae bacterium]|jgi:predicted GNAT superfamily acetyltransferase|nr:acetyltransferase [Solibacteraceae bacterium]MCO5351152.1 acetyltransferase [Bryobacteraceae bacterium]
MPEPVLIRRLETLPEFEEAVRLQQEIWGFRDIELLPQRLFVVASKVGGQVLGAFVDERMIGFLLAIPGLKPGKDHPWTYLHSHMAGVLPEFQGRHIGRLLKLEQRRLALDTGIRLIEWTFDPLEIRNAWFNIERLGAVVRRYVLNQYGVTTSALHAGLPTDRCVAEWYVDSPRVHAILSDERPEPLPVEARIPVPVTIDTLRRDDPREARAVQARVSEQFVDATARGLTVIGFEKSPEFGTYLLGPWNSPSMP